MKIYTALPCTWAQATHINVPLISVSSYYNACFIDNKALHLEGLWWVALIHEL